MLSGGQIVAGTMVPFQMKGSWQLTLEGVPHLFPLVTDALSPLALSPHRRLLTLSLVTTWVHLGGYGGMELASPLALSPHGQPWELRRHEPSVVGAA